MLQNPLLSSGFCDQIGLSIAIHDFMDSQNSSPEDIVHVSVAEQDCVNSAEQGRISVADQDRIIEMAWEDRTSFDIIQQQFGVSEAEVIKIMRRSMKRSSFLMWRERVRGRKTKHSMTSPAQRFKCDRQDKPK